MAGKEKIIFIIVLIFAIFLPFHLLISFFTLIFTKFSLNPPAEVYNFVLEYPVVNQFILLFFDNTQIEIRIFLTILFDITFFGLLLFYIIEKRK